MKKRLSLLFAAVLAVVAALAVIGCTDDETEGTLDVTLTVECLALVENPDAVADPYKAVVPEDGYFFNAAPLKAKENESLYDFVIRVCRAENLPVAAQDGYISSIGNLSDAATTGAYWGGWTFTVNGQTPMDGETWLSAPQVTLKAGDAVSFSYMIGALGEY